MELTFGKRLRALRRTKDLSQEKLAVDVGVSRVAITQWENDQARPEGKNIEALAHALGTTEQWLLYGEGEPPVIRNDSGVDENKTSMLLRKLDRLALDAGRAEAISNTMRPSLFNPTPMTYLSRWEQEQPRPDFTERGALESYGYVVGTGVPFTMRHDNHEVPVAQMTDAMAYKINWLVNNRRTDPLEVLTLIEQTDGMAPTIAKGDMLTINAKVTEVTEPGIYAMRYDPHCTILTRRLQRQADGSIVIMSDNPAYRDDILPRGPARIWIVGRVVMIHKPV